MPLRLGLLSDTHLPESRSELWPHVFEAFDGVDHILHGGDVHDFALLDELERIAPVFCARGNGDDGEGGRVRQPDDPRARHAWTLEFEQVTVGLTHFIPVEPSNSPRLQLAHFLERFFPEKRPDVIVSGDSHKAIVKEIDGILCVNPGSPTYPHHYDTQLGTVGFLDIDGARADASLFRLTSEGLEAYDPAVPAAQQFG